MYSTVIYRRVYDSDRYVEEEWVDEALERIHWPPADAPAVCVIDSGVNRGHPLIEPLLADITRRVLSD